MGHCRAETRLINLPSVNRSFKNQPQKYDHRYPHCLDDCRGEGRRRANSNLPFFPLQIQRKWGKKSAQKEKNKKKKMGAENFSMQLIASQKSRYTSNRRYAIRIKKKRRDRKREERQGGTKESHSGMIVKSYPRAMFVEAFPNEDP